MMMTMLTKMMMKNTMKIMMRMVIICSTNYLGDDAKRSPEFEKFMLEKEVETLKIEQETEVAQSIK